MATPAALPIAKPLALRLVRHEGGRAALRVPFGLIAFVEGADAVAVALDVASGGELDDLARAAAQIPAARELPPRTLVVVLGDADRDDGLLTRLFSGGRTVLPRALRASALLARGYVDIGAGVDPDSGLDLAWGFAPAEAGAATESADVTST